MRLSAVALLLIHGAVAAEESREWVLPEVSVPRVQRVLFESNAAKESVSCYVFTPESYEQQSEKRFPVLYWLHGSGGGAVGMPQVAQRFDAAMKAGKMPPTIVVFPNGIPMGMWCDWKDGSVKMETIVVEELIPHIDRTFRTISKREGRMIEGFSMGGYGAARIGFKYPHLFAAVSSLAGGPLQLDFNDALRAGPRGRDQVLGTVYGGDMAYFEAQSPWRIVEQNADKLRSGLLIRQIIGDRDETLRFNRTFHEHLEGLQIPHRYQELRGIPHDPNALLKTLGEENWAFYTTALSERNGN